jgi:hypothetical protein
MGHYGINFNPSYYDTRKYCAPNLLPAALFQESHIFLALVSLVAIADLHENWRKVKFSKTNGQSVMSANREIWLKCLTSFVFQ